MAKTHLMKNYLLKMAQSLYITEIYMYWQPNCTKLKMDFRQKFFPEFFAREIEFHYNLRDHSIITFALRGKGVHQNVNICEQGEEGGVSHQCEISHINFFD